MIGQTLDRYRLESKLGEGGMGVVYKARDTQLDRLVAIKVLPAEKVSDRDRKQRFIQEAKAASALNHPNIITIHDIRADGGIDFIVMEYAGGRTLDAVIPANGLGVTRALRYAVQIAAALARAHEAGIVHRDLKPSNVVVTDDDRVKVLDFGLAKLVEPPDRADEAPTRTSPITEIGTIVGTAAYMSPEQAEGRAIDARSDIFSLGAVLYEMVTGRRAFTGDSTLSVLAKIVNEEPPPPSSHAASVPLDVERAILRCLRKDPARRYQTMADLKVALEDLATDSAAGHLPPAAPRMSRVRPWMWATLIPIALGTAYIAWRATRLPDRTPALRPVPLTALKGVVSFPSFSPDGNHVAFTWTGPAQDNADVYVQQVGAGGPLRLTTDPAADYAPAWSPDGRAIAFLRRGSDPRLHELRLVAPLGGPERKIADIRPRGFLRAVTLAWCPDSACVVLTDSADDAKPDALVVVSVDSGEKRTLTMPPASLLADTDPAVSPDGRSLVFRRDVGPFSGELQLLPLGDAMTVRGNARSLTSIAFGAYGPRWISNDEIVFSARGALWRLSTSPGSVPERLPFAGEDGSMPAVALAQSDRAGRLVYVRSYTDTNVWKIDTTAPGAPAAAPPVLAISSTRRDALPQFSPDGQRIAFISDRSGESELWLADSAGTNAVQLTSMAANPGFPRWSPDGTRIAFHSNPAGQGDIFTVSPEGGKPRTVVSGPDNEAFATFSRDGQWMYFSAVQHNSIWKVPVSGGTRVLVVSSPVTLALESPDRAFLYYVKSNLLDLPGPLWRLPLKGGEPVKVADNVIPTAFDVVEGGMYYLERAAGQSRLRYFPFATERSTIVAENLGSVFGGLAASRDGRTILFTRVDSSVNDLMIVDNFR